MIDSDEKVGNANLKEVEPPSTDSVARRPKCRMEPGSMVGGQTCTLCSWKNHRLNLSALVQHVPISAAKTNRLQKVLVCYLNLIDEL